MKKKIKMPLDSEMVRLLEDNNYTPLEEWKANANVQCIEENSKNSIKGSEG
jgi:hypothetical protein